MRYVEVGGVRVSAIGLGTWQFGSREWGFGDADADEEADAITRRALDLGINLIDTAEVYGMGRSERIVGRAIGGRRAETFVGTKLFPLLPVAPIVELRARASRRRLGVDRIDLYQLHWSNRAVPLHTTMDGLRRLRSDGVVDQVGVSNFTLARWRAAETVFGSPVLSNQVRYSLAARRPERDLLAYAGAADRLIIAYSPLAQGLLSGKYGVDYQPRTAVQRSNPLLWPENLVRARPLLDALREVARAHDATPAQVALAWVIRHRNVVAIPGARTVAQLQANAAAADLDLSADENATLTAAADRFEPLGIGAASVQRLVKRRAPNESIQTGS